jgi:hypothetical protein
MRMESEETFKTRKTIQRANQKKELIVFENIPFLVHVFSLVDRS